MNVRARRLGQFSWALYDWAGSAFSSVIITFVYATYFSQGIAEDPVTGTAEWGWAMSASGIVVALVSPVLGAIADAGGRRKPWLAAFTALSVSGCLLLWYGRPSPEMALAVLVIAALTNVAFEIAGVFYNAMLPEIVSRDYLGRLSGWAWGLGYAGGLACLIITLYAFVQAEHPLFGLDRSQAEDVRISGPLVGLWMAVFSLPLFLFTPDRSSVRLPAVEAVRRGFGQLRDTFADIRRDRSIGRFLLARMIYNDGLNTLFVFGGIYAAGTFNMGMAEVIKFGIVLNVTAGLGALAFGWIDDLLGAKRTILIALVGLLACGTAAVLVESTAGFWVAGSLLGIFVGPAQAASRSLMSRIAPARKRTEMFGLYALSGKVTAFVGPFVLGSVTYWSGSQRLGIATILIFFLVGMALLLPLDEAEQTKQAAHTTL
ncbi:MAG: MFS transporter [Gammaproteobacteria bacterium]|nr:MFS transporter [Gammaproteobacteria bacterium]